MKLRTKLAIVLLVITVLLSVATTGGLELYKQQQISQTQQSVNETADLTTTQIEGAINQLKDDVGYVASQPSMRRFGENQAYVDSFLGNTRFWAAQVIAANGTVISFRGDITEAQRQQTIGTDQSNTTYFTRAIDGEPYLSTPEYANTTGRYLTIISAPILTDNGTKGVFAAAIWIDTETFFRAVPPLETSIQTVQIVEDDKTLHRSQRSFNQTISGSATVESTGWRVIVTRDASGLTTELRNLAIAQGGGLAAVLLLVIGLGYWQYTTNLRQTERLLEGFGEIQKGNYEYSLSLGAGEEWIQISDGFNDLSLGLKRREERLRERQQRLEVLYRVLRHNLRNEMSIVQNYAGIINDMAGEEPIRDAAETILDAGEDLIGLSEKARQIENALQEASTEPTTIDAGGVVSEVVEDMREEYPEVNLEASIPETAWARAIPSFQLAVENVCENACKHNDADEPLVEVSVDTNGPTDLERAAETPDLEADGGTAGGDGQEPDAGTVTIDIADNGPGIPEQDRNVLKQGRETALEHGSGLGLWLVYWVVDKSGGVLGFDENEPRGSIVTMELDGAPAPEDDAGTDDGDDADGDEAADTDAEEDDTGGDVPGSPDDDSTDAFA